MSKSDDGGAAFPISVQPDFHYAEGGMTLRDYFAGQALNIALADCPRPTPRDSWQGGVLRSSSPAYMREMDQWRSELASAAYRFADAMIAARSKGGDGE